MSPGTRHPGYSDSDADRVCRERMNAPRLSPATPISLQLQSYGLLVKSSRQQCQRPREQAGDILYPYWKIAKILIVHTYLIILHGRLKRHFSFQSFSTGHLFTPHQPAPQFHIPSRQMLRSTRTPALAQPTQRIIKNRRGVFCLRANHAD